MSELARATALIADPDRQGVHHGEVPDGWQQGRGAFGGVTVGLLTRAILATEADRDRKLRSLTADLCAPLLPGPVEVRASVLRRGKSVTYLDAQLFSGDELIARASAALAVPRDVPPIAVRHEPPERPPWRDVAPIPLAPPFAPVFAPKFEFRATGPFPFTSGPEPLASGYIREKTPPESLDAPAMAGLLDAWWPSIFSIESGPRALGTIGFTMQLLVDPASLPAKDPLYHRARAVGASDNFFVEMRELWSGDVLVAMNQQTIALSS
ncbi:MAG: thioesterase family protein [Sandaracinaceae bacterium]